MQYNAALAIAGVIRGCSREKLYQELGVESLQQLRWFRKLCYFFKITKINPLSFCLIKSPPLGQHIKQEIISATFLGSMSDMLFKKTRYSRSL